MNQKNATQTGQEPGFYIVIPATVWYDERLRPNSTKLYGILSTLCNREGYCWASDDYLGDMLHQSDRTVREIIKELRDCGHIWVERDGDRRQIWLREPPAETAKAEEPPAVLPGQTELDPAGENPPNDLGENPPENNKSLYRSNNYNSIPPCVSPMGEARDARKEELEHMWTAFWNAYPKKVDKKDAYRKFMRLRPDRKLFQTILAALEAQKQSRQWQNVQYVPSPARWIGKELWTNDLGVYAPPEREAPPDEGVVYW